MPVNYLLSNQQSDRLLFRPIQLTDCNAWLKFFTDPQTSLYWVSENQTPEMACGKWYEKQFYRYEHNLGGMNALIEKSSGALIGHAGLLVQEVDGKEELEIAYSLLPQFWNRGYAIEAAQKCKTFAFENSFSESLISIISLPNLPSQKVAIRNGMTIERETTYRNIPVYIFRIFQSSNAEKA